MNHLHHRILAPSVLALVASCTSNTVPSEFRAHLAALRECESMEIFAIDPHSAFDGPIEGADRLRGCRVLARAKVELGADRAALACLVAEGLSASDGTVAACFLPRHGVRVETAGKAHEIVVCYECLTLRAWAPDATECLTIPTSNHVAAALTALFERHGLEIAGSE
ncbi:MAG: hypothetical protein FJ298_10430 [Planctomycetes bacterium]|nr:hypothetical protein [Planctomycetota bacterium]